MTNEDLIAIGKELSTATREYVRKCTDALSVRIKALEDRPIRDGRDGIDGKDGAPGPQGLKGDPGDRGSDGSIGEPGPKGDAGEPGAIGAQGPAGEAGRNGVDGTQGPRGERGETGAVGPQGPQGEIGPVGPTGPEGARGEKGFDGARGERGEQGPQGDRGIDGKSFTIEDVRPMFEAEVAKTLLDLERRAMDLVQRAADRMPVPPPGKDGKDGKDAIGPDDVHEEYEDGGRVLVRRWMRDGQIVKELRHTQKSLIYRDTYKFDREYLYGDVVTWDGGMWMTLVDHPKGQPAVSPEWKLVVMRGKVGAKGPQGPQGPEGKPGPAGGKW